MNSLKNKEGKQNSPLDCKGEENRTAPNKRYDQRVLFHHSNLYFDP